MEQEKQAAQKTEEAAAQREQRQTTAGGGGGTAATQLVAAAGVRRHNFESLSSSTSRSSSVASSDDADSARRAQGLVPLRCDHAAFPFNRSSGVIFKPPKNDRRRVKSSNGSRAPGATADDIMVSEVPVGIDYYGALQQAWSRQPEVPPKLPPLAREQDVNLSEIDDVLSGDSDYEELHPPVPLGLMISYFAEDWRESGLYDVVQKREEAMSYQTQPRGQR